MPHDFTVSTKLTVIAVTGLMPPRRNSAAHVFLWTKDGIHRPDFFRWSWHPATGDLVAGTVHRHVNQIPSDPVRPFESWLRGFVFRPRILAIRPFFWPSGPYDCWDHRHAEVNLRVVTAFRALVRQHVGRMKMIADIDNQWLKQTYGHLATSW